MNNESYDNVNTGNRESAENYDRREERKLTVCGLAAYAVETAVAIYLRAASGSSLIGSGGRAVLDAVLAVGGIGLIIWAINLLFVMLVFYHDYPDAQRKAFPIGSRPRHDKELHAATGKLWKWTILAGIIAVFFPV